MGFTQQEDDMSSKTVWICDGCNESSEYLPNQWKRMDVWSHGVIGDGKQYDLCPDCYLRIMDVVR